MVNQHYSSHQPAYFQSNDEIDFKELFVALWQGKWTVVAFATLFSVGAVIYALIAQEWWSSKAKITQSQPQDMSSYQQQVKQFQPVFDIYQEDGTVLVSDELDGLVDTEVLFQRFIDAFNSSSNKRNFLESSEEFQSFKAELALISDPEIKKSEARKLYSEWFQRISAKAVNPKLEFSPYDVLFQSTTQGSSSSLLSGYIRVIQKKAHADALNNLQAIVNGKRNELKQQKLILESQAKNKLLVEIERAEYALLIAKSAGVNKPIQTNSDNELFGIDMGAKGLEAKVKALKSISNLSVIEPRLQQIDAKLDMLKNLEIDRSIQFQTFRFLENVEQPITRDKPKRALIAALGTLLGGMLGVAIVLVRFAYRREEESN
ncbi:Wzz/FepE/Etk N-terminal domain-containing protein [Vibrio sp. DBSS07]|uniref:Wzz/FepE/Etk N-terminal domain-containing protein n=2 Tax=Vibrio paucivorans TaxID=2829489 RepID=A0A9X3HU55_9VIBR|nr:Wzz/FepE/Etk N-terminal domain-containing protein [Vibrio paucivorans]MCW8336279.1 Wzz/FepE/Etk N-terminal domain-containing protein [Vibrio paucivorans]